MWQFFRLNLLLINFTINNFQFTFFAFKNYNMSCHLWFIKAFSASNRTLFFNCWALCLYMLNKPFIKYLLFFTCFLLTPKYKSFQKILFEFINLIYLSLFLTIRTLYLPTANLKTICTYLTKNYITVLAYYSWKSDDSDANCAFKFFNHLL